MVRAGKTSLCHNPQHLQHTAESTLSRTERMDGWFLFLFEKRTLLKDYTYNRESTEQTSKKLFFKCQNKNVYEFQNYTRVTGLFHKTKLGWELIVQSYGFLCSFSLSFIVLFFPEGKYNTSVIKNNLNALCDCPCLLHPSHNQLSILHITSY